MENLSNEDRKYLEGFFLIYSDASPLRSKDIVIFSSREALYNRR
jgi:hypothetical protein